MRILFYLTRYPGIGGIENVTSLIVSELTKDAAYEVDVVSHLQQAGAVVPDFGGRIFHMPNPKEWRARENYAFAEKLVREGNYDVIVYQDSYAPTEDIVCSLSQKYHIPLLVFEHSSPLFVSKKRDLLPLTSLKGLARRILHPWLLKKDIRRKRKLLGHAVKYVQLSERSVTEFCRLVGYANEGKVTFINNPLPSEVQVQSSPKENLLLYVGRLVPEKGVDRMLAIWAKLQDEFPEWKFVIVGDGPERIRLEKIVRDRKLVRVNFEGFQEPGPYYAKARLFLMMSRYEGWGLTLCEAMRRGIVPVVLDTFSAVHDIIVDKQNGFLAKDETVFYQLLCDLMRNPEKMERVGRNAMTVTEKFSIDVIVRRWKSLLQSCVENR